MPTPWMGLQVAVPHWPSLPWTFSTEGVHSRMQYCLPVGSLSAQSGVAVTPAGTSVGQEVPEHGGVQTSPAMPVMRTEISSEAQPAFALQTTSCVTNYKLKTTSLQARN